MQSLFGENKRETPEAIKAEIKGEIPKWLQGVLIRNGPGMHKIGDTVYNHWFDGLSLLHSFTFENGEVFYRSKYLQSDTYKRNIEANRIVVSEFGTMAYPDPCKNIFSKLSGVCTLSVPALPRNIDGSFLSTDAACPAELLQHSMCVARDFQHLQESDVVTLDLFSVGFPFPFCVNRVDYANYVPLNLATSHPHYDGNGNSYNIGTSIAEKGKTKYLIVKVPTIKPDDKNACFKNCEIFCSIPCRSLLSPSYYHSFGMTENYIIFLEQPFKLDILKMATAYFKGINWASCLGWYPKEKTYIHIIDRKTKKALPMKFYTDALVVYHHVNAYEENNHVLIDIIAYEDNSLYEMFYLANMKLDDNEFKNKGKSFTLPQCRRFVIPLDIDENTEIGTNIVRLQGTTAQALKEQDGHVYCTPEVLFEGVELPRINYDYNGKKYRYIYASRVQWKPIPTKVLKTSCPHWITPVEKQI
ncbi:beta,beta-carotene 15,15'-dioxygenase-like isoform X3 [Hypanus sabinus]|uniref:beta,beta-carotene 15,15'-dioxygenase-like isoform X3 n=1 Tax=Hypanus sabinus TaxID=79690 RepID=UPI0028C42F71|nr:beta,beta-carotene 15,15'-dioxygenase-like isoform X3 [Hypanus sabinus]